MAQFLFSWLSLVVFSPSPFPFPLRVFEEVPPGHILLGFFLDYLCLIHFIFAYAIFLRNVPSLFPSN